MAARFVRGHQHPVTVAVDSATVIAAGDLVWLDTDDAKPAADLAWDTNLATTQETFHDNFLGVAIRGSAAGETEPIEVATCGVWSFDAASDTYEIGQLVGPDKAAGNAILSQTIEDVATANLAVGRVVKTSASTTTDVHVDIVSTVVHGGPQAMA